MNKFTRKNSRVKKGGVITPKNKALVGYIYKWHPLDRLLVFYKSIQELRLMCGEIPGDAIQKVVVSYEE